MKNLRYIGLGALMSVAFMACEKEELTSGENGPAGKNQVTIGQGGSLAQFTIVDDYLYTVDYRTLHVFHLADAANPVELETIDLGVGIETIFPQNGYLYIGCQDGMKIFDITNPRSPVEVSEYEHVTSCDPIAANDQLAVATLRGGTECGGNLNQLDLFDVSDVTNPKLINTEALNNPYGVGFSTVNPVIVYVCDGVDGLKAYDLTMTSQIEQVMHMEDIEALDVISGNDNTLIVLSRFGVYQFDASDPVNLIEKSFIPIQ